MFIVCSKCKEEKPKQAFHNNKRRHNGKSAYCISCDKERKKAYLQTEKGREASRKRQEKHRQNNPESVKKATIRNRKKKQDLVDNYKSTGCCICGYNRCLQALDLHHMNPLVKEDTVSNLIFSSGIERLEEEVKKCVVLCANCHREHHAGLLQIPVIQ